MLGAMGDIGLNLIKGIWNGISDAAGWIMDKIKGFGKGILDGIKGFFGIKSPSTLFKEEVGKNLALGLGEGFTGAMGDITKEMKGAIPTSFDTQINPYFDAPSGSSLAKESGSTKNHNYNVTINNNSKFTSPAENARLFRKEMEFFKLKEGMVTA